MAHQSWGEGGGVATTHRHNSLGLKPTTEEEFNREVVLGSDQDNHNINTTIRNQPQHHYTPAIPLSSTFQAHPHRPHAATAAEISNHQEVNAQLQEIKETLKKLIKENPKTETPTVPPKGPE
jgi:hypothetical protein